MYKLLIVDDESLIRNGLSNIIKWNQLGFDLIGAVENAKLALEIMEENRIDVLLTDISMPEMSGLELIKVLKEKNPKLKTVVISGYNEFDYAIEAIKLKVETYILKPLDPQKINEVFEKIKINLDEEHEVESKEHYLQAKYELMRILYNDMISMKNSSGDYREKKKYQLILFQIVYNYGIENSDSLIKWKNEVIRLLKGHIYRNVDNLFAIITFSSQADVLLKGLKKSFAKDSFHSFKAAVSVEFSELSDITAYYLSTANMFKSISPGEVAINDETIYSLEQKYFETYMEQLIKIIESGEYNKVKDIVDDLYCKLSKNNGVNPYEIGMKLLRNIMLYFRIDNVSLTYFSELLPKFSEEREKGQEYFNILKQEFLKDMEKVLEYLKDNSESMSIMLSYKARQLVNENFTDKELSLRSIADKLNVSYGYLSTEFTKTFGINFKAYVVSVRIEKARELLMERNLKVYEIADYVGYSSSRYFTDAFKKRYGISPLDYLKRINSGL